MRKQLALVNTEALPQPQNLKGSGVCVGRGVMCAHLPSTSPNTTTQLLSPEKNFLSQEIQLEMTKNRNL